MKSPSVVKCPTCKKVGPWLSQPSGPFCSRRCQLVDLGKWFNEEPRISEPLRPGHFQEYENLPSGEELDRPPGEQSSDEHV
jgi:endogenous inhibitor of DNA gyrase (YacG/DUF329 family)